MQRMDRRDLPARPRGKWLGESRKHTDFSRPIRLKFLVGLPDAKSNVPPFCVSPIEFRQPEPTNVAQVTIAQHEGAPTKAFERARTWQVELANDSSLRRADSARREGLTRARVTQLLALNRIPPEALQELRQRVAANKRPISTFACYSTSRVLPAGLELRLHALQSTLWRRVDVD